MYMYIACIIVLHASHVWYAYNYGIVLYYYRIVLYCGGMLELQAPTTRGMLESQDATIKGMLEPQDSYVV